MSKQCVCCGQALPCCSRRRLLFFFLSSGGIERRRNAVDLYVLHSTSTVATPVIHISAATIRTILLYSVRLDDFFLSTSLID